MANINEQMQVKMASVGQLTPGSFDVMCKQFFAENGKRLSGLAKNEDDARTIFLAAMNAVSRSPFLLQAAMEDFPGFARCIATSCELRLFPGPMAECAYVPMRNGKTGKQEIQFWPMYQGLLKLAFNSGFVKSVSIDVVYKNDDFDYQKGTTEYLKHVPYLGDRKERGERICAYAVINTIYGAQIEIVPMHSIESIRNKSRAGNSEFSPWNIKDADNYDAMAKKTALKRALKLIPKSATLSQALEIDDESEGVAEPKASTVEMAKVMQLPTADELKEISNAESPVPEKTDKTKSAAPPTDVPPTKRNV